MHTVAPAGAGFTSKVMSDEVTDSDPCLHSVIFAAESGQPIARHVFEWPSGARTVVDIGASPYGETSDYVRINGVPGRRVLDQKGPHCILNNTSGNTLCVSR